MLLEITSDTWIVTGLGFGIVLALLFCLVFILMFFGWVMQKATAPRAPKQEKTSPEGGPHIVQTPKTEAKPVAAPAAEAEMAAVAYALYLAQEKRHDIPTAMISIRKHETAWNEKSIGLNNIGF